MKLFKKTSILFVLLALCLFGINCDTATRDNSLSHNLSAATPEEVGMSSERLSRLSIAMQELVDDSKLAGIVTMVARHGKIVHF